MNNCKNCGANQFVPKHGYMTCQYCGTSNEPHYKSTREMMLERGLSERYIAVNDHTHHGMMGYFLKGILLSSHRTGSTGPK